MEEIQKQQLYKGKGGEIIRTAICHFIHAISQAGLHLETPELMSIFGTIKENLKHTNSEIQDVATNAMQSFCLSYFKDEISSRVLITELMSMVKASMYDDNISVTRGFNMAFGVLSTHVLERDNLYLTLIRSLMQNCLPKKKESDDAETRK